MEAMQVVPELLLLAMVLMRAMVVGREVEEEMVQRVGERE